MHILYAGSRTRRNRARSLDRARGQGISATAPSVVIVPPQRTQRTFNADAIVTLRFVTVRAHPTRRRTVVVVVVVVVVRKPVCPSSSSPSSPGQSSVVRAIHPSIHPSIHRSTNRNHNRRRRRRLRSSVPPRHHHVSLRTHAPRVVVVHAACAISSTNADVSSSSRRRSHERVARVRARAIIWDHTSDHTCVRAWSVVCVSWWFGCGLYGSWRLAGSGMSCACASARARACVLSRLRVGYFVCACDDFVTVTGRVCRVRAMTG